MGVAFCSPEEQNFNKETGRRIAAERLRSFLDDRSATFGRGWVFIAKQDEGKYKYHIEKLLPGIKGPQWFQKFLKVYKEPTSDVLTYVLKDEGKPNMRYEKIPFKNLKKGDKFATFMPDGTPMPNIDGSLVCIADEDPYLTELSSRKTTHGIRGTAITKAIEK